MLVRDVIIGQVHVVHTCDTLRKAARVLVEHHVGAVPVLDKTASLVGRLSSVDLLRAVSDMTDQR
jgi:acetoin utilization protein AcuB